MGLHYRGNQQWLIPVAGDVRLRASFQQQPERKPEPVRPGWSRWRKCPWLALLKSFPQYEPVVLRNPLTMRASIKTGFDQRVSRRVVRAQRCSIKRLQESDGPGAFAADVVAPARRATATTARRSRKATPTMRPSLRNRHSPSQYLAMYFRASPVGDLAETRARF